MDDDALVDLRCSALLLRGDSVLVCRRTDSPDVWVLPGGTPRLGEGTATAAKREVAEETGLHLELEGVAFVLEATSWDAEHHLVEIVFSGADADPHREPVQLEDRLVPSFVPLERLHRLGLRPPIAGYIRGFARTGRTPAKPRRSTAAYLGNVWRPTASDARSEVRR